jgi:hypothetical protein
MGFLGFRVAQLGRTVKYDITLRFGNLEFTMSTYEMVGTHILGTSCIN